MKNKFWTDNRIVCTIVYSVLLLGGFIYYLILENTDLSFPCAYFEITGKMCAGCGLTRMFYSIFELDFVKAFSYNSVMLVLLCIWNVIGLANLVGKPKVMSGVKFLTVCGIASVLAILIFWAYRGIC